MTSIPLFEHWRLIPDQNAMWDISWECQQEDKEMDVTQERYDKDKKFIYAFCVVSGAILTALFLYIFGSVLSLHLAG